MPILTLARATDLPLASLSATAGRISAPLSLCVPACMVVLVAGRKGLRGVLPAALTCGVSFAVVTTVSNLIGPELTDILAAITAIASLVLLFKIWQPKECIPADPTATTTAPTTRYSASEIFRAWLPYAYGGLCLVLGPAGLQGRAGQNQHLHRMAGSA